MTLCRDPMPEEAELQRRYREARAFAAVARKTVPRDAPSPWWFYGILTIVFTAMKLTGLVPLPWCWVLSPLWIPLGGAVAVFAAIQIGCLLQR